MTTKSNSLLPLWITLGLGFLIFTIGIKINYPMLDEIYFTDPAINFATGHGYTTTAWNITPQTEPHVSTAPAYSFLLSLWLKVFGLSEPVVRSLPVLLALFSVLLFWRSCLRAGWFKSGWAGGLLVLTLLLGFGFAFTYTCGRPDSLSALLVTAMFYFSTLKNQRLGLGAIGALALFMPFVQWGCVIYLAFLSAALVLISWKKNLRYALVIGAGMAAGLLLQKMLYTHWGIWDIWMSAVKSEGSESMAQRISYRLTLASLRDHKNSIPKDLSVFVIMAGMALLYGWNKLRHRPENARLSIYAWVIVGLVTLGMYFVGKFPTYYCWMLIFPLGAILAAYFDRAWAQSRREAGLIAAIALLSGLVGLPLQAGVASYDWVNRNPAPITAWLDSKISPDDVVYCDYPFYYIAKTRAKQVFTGRYIQEMSPADFASLTVAIIGTYPSDWKRPLTNATVIGTWKQARPRLLGTDWKYGMLSAPDYGCTVYRFKEPPQTAGGTP